MFKQLISQIIAQRATIAMGMAMAGVVVTAVVAGKDHENCKKELISADAEELPNKDDEFLEEYMSREDKHYPGEVIGKKRAAIIFAKTHWRTGMAMAVTFALMIFSHHTMAKELAATAAALGIMTTKYKELAQTLKEKYPEQYEKVMDIINEKNAQKAGEEKLVKEETYDGRQKYYEPVTKQIFYATREQLFDAERHLTDLFNEDGMATVGQLILWIKEHADKHIKYKYEYDKLGWCPFDDTFAYESKHRDGKVVSYVHIDPSKLAHIKVHGQEHDVHTLLYSVYPYKEPGIESLGI